MPADPRPETGSTNAPSSHSGGGDTVLTSRAPAPGAPAPGFGPPVATGEVGTLGPYRVVKELGKGGMGAVYAAIDTRLERRLALKVMLPEFAADAGAKARFLREARAAAKISHDNVVTVYEADEREGVPYIAMQFLEGYPLDQYLQTKGCPTIPQVLRIVAEAAAGLSAAHKIGLVHRDIKPGNLWLEAPHGRVKVLDFGLAKPLDAEVELTKSGAVMGTPAYMSPEQARGQKVDPRADLFSLGAVMYRLCTGRLPFNGPTTMAVLMALGMEEPAPVRELNPAVPEPLAALVHQLLSKRAEARPQSAAEVVKRIRDITENLAGQRGQPAEVSVSQPQLMQPQVVYVPIQVTAFESNPFANLDAPSTEMASREVAEPKADPKSEREKPVGRWLWPAVGFAALLALMVGSLIVIIKNKDGTQTVAEKDKDGKTPAPVGPGKNPQVADTSADRKVAAWVIAQGGYVHVNGEHRRIKDVTELPKERFTLTHAHLNSRSLRDEDLRNLNGPKELKTLSLESTPGVSNAGLAHLKELKSITELFLSNTGVTDEGFVHLKEMTGLTKLDLINCPVLDAGLATLKEFKSLAYLQLHGTGVTNAGLAHLKEIKSLTYLSVRKAGMVDVRMNVVWRVTAKGAEELAAALPGCKIEYEGGTIEAIDPDRAAAAWVISQGGFVGVNGKNGDIKAVSDLPKDRFTLHSVSLGGQVSDAGMLRLRQLKGLTNLDAHKTKLADSGLERLGEQDVKTLQTIHLGDTQVSDGGLRYLKEFKDLRVLYLSGTKVTDAGLVHLKELKALTLLDVQKTKVTKKELESFHAALPNCKIEHDGGVIEPKK